MQTSYGYDPYGISQITGTASSNPYQYTGRENDGTGLLHYRARYYNPAWARFVSEDPIGLNGGINVYAYVGNNPIQLRDLSGKLFLRWLFPPSPSPSPSGAKNGGGPQNDPTNPCPAGAVCNTRSGDLPATGQEPNSTQVKDNGAGKGQIRDYGPDGRAVKDIDFGHNHPTPGNPQGPGDPHAHDWDWSKYPGGDPRLPGRPIGPLD